MSSIFTLRLFFQCMAVITHTFFSVLHYGDWLYVGGLLVTGHDFCFTALSSSNLKALPPFPFNGDMYSVYHVVMLTCLFRGLSRLSTNLSCHGRSNGMREKLSGPPIFETSYKM